MSETVKAPISDLPEWTYGDHLSQPWCVPLVWSPKCTVCGVHTGYCLWRGHYAKLPSDTERPRCARLCKDCHAKLDSGDEALRVIMVAAFLLGIE